MPTDLAEEVTEKAQIPGPPRLSVFPTTKRPEARHSNTTLSKPIDLHVHPLKSTRSSAITTPLSRQV